jgi:hypothetical protein
MSIKQSSAYCPVCGRQSLFQKPRINHILHLILSIVTVGIWAIAWVIMGISNSARRPRCVTCGAEMPMGGSFKSPVPSPQVQAHIQAHPYASQQHPYHAPPDPTTGLAPPQSQEPMAGCRQCGAEFGSWGAALDHAEAAHGLDPTSEQATALIHRY